METLSLEYNSIINNTSFTIDNIEELKTYFDAHRSIEFIQKVIDNKIKFDIDSMIYMMETSSIQREQEHIITINEDEKEHYVVGDIHADSVSLNQILKKTLFYDDYQNKRIIFLGDYVDRGKNRLNVINLLIALEFLIPSNIIILKGNHELFIKDEKGKIQSPMKGRESSAYFFTFLNMMSEHEQYKKFFPNRFIEAYAFYFEKLLTMAILDFKDIKIVAVHGGIPRADLNTVNYYDNLDNLDELFIEGKRDNIGMSLRNNLLWSDPYDRIESGFRNTSLSRFKFSKNQFISFCKKFNIDMIVRAHEALDDGYKTYYDNRLISVFSTGGKDLDGNTNKNSHYSSVTPNILKINTLEQTIESYEIFFSDKEMLCEKSYLFNIVKSSRQMQEEQYEVYEPINTNLPLHSCLTLQNAKILYIKDKYNSFALKRILLEGKDKIELNYYSFDLFDMYGVHKDFSIIIDCKNNTLKNNNDVKIYVDRFVLNKGDILPFVCGEFKLESGAILNFGLVE